ILLIDEAQNLTYDTLKTIHHLFNFSTRNEFLIQIALFGQPELHKRIARFKSLSSRMYMAKLQPFNPQQTQEMMQFRWTVAGGQELPFDQQAIAEIYRFTGGKAREICKLANETLLHAAVENKQIVTKDTVQAAAADAFETA
ncbi:MAG: AAA family ATPase, partial [Chloroflexi bacterium]|nr:AAA family ATPase [Chloroflexota bacterium]